MNARFESAVTANHSGFVVLWRKRSAVSLTPLPKSIHFLTESSNFVTQFLKLPHHLVHYIAFVKSVVLVQFPLGGVSSFRDMLGDIVESGMVIILDKSVRAPRRGRKGVLRNRRLEVRILWGVLATSSDSA